MYNCKEVEENVLKFWKKNKIYEKAKAKNKGKKSYYFLDGPPYTSGRVHIGTAWNKSLKDCILRYKRMNKLDVWDRAGYDMHGLPTAHKVQEKFKLHYKEDIEKFGVGKFITECKKLSIENMQTMNDDFIRLGVWMDFKNAYQSATNDFIEGVWWLIKKADDNKRLYEGERTMHWCASCSTSLAKHELEYKYVTDESVFVKLPVKNNHEEYLIIWTTTPWTIPFNLAVMVNPDVDYIRAKVDGEVWIVAKDLAEGLIKKVADKDFKIIEEFKGKKLEGVKYRHPFEDEIKDYARLRKKHKKIHSVVLSKEYVDTSSGSGLVHCAPGCGPEDYEVGHRENLPPYNTLDERGVFSSGMGKFSSLVAKRDDDKFIEELKKKSKLIAITDVEHDYAHCWRCHHPVIYRTTVQWFFKVEDLKAKMKQLNKKIKWVPNWAGAKQFHSWLDNLRDNSITKQRYWGVPLPIWKCKKCNDYTVVGSVSELKKLTGKVPKQLYKPWIDKINIKCRCGSKKERILDILDVWVDAGTTSWNCLDFPKRQDLFKKLWPADFILEGKDQIRGWFNLLLVASMVSIGKPSFKSVYMHGFVQDTLGRKMSKSLGNYILPGEVVDKHGADILRYYMIGGTNAGIDINYNFDDMEVRRKNLLILFNLSNYLINYGKNIKLSINIKGDLEEKYILSRLNSTIKNSTDLFEQYRIDEIPEVIEELFLELSRTYIQWIREKASIGKEKEKQIVFSTIFKILLETLKLLAPITPFITEKIYQDLRKTFNLKEESIHLFDWPKYNNKEINTKLEKDVNLSREVIQEILSKREETKMGVRWPMSLAKITTENPSSIKKLESIIKKQTNIKKLEIKKGKSKVELNTKLTPELEKEGFTREVIRRIQRLRKKAGLRKEDRINLDIKSKIDLNYELIKKTAGAKNIETLKKAKVKDKFKIKEEDFEISFNTTK